MIRQRRRNQVTAFLALDVLTTLVSFGLAFYLRFYAPLVPVTKGIPDPWEYARVLPILILVWPVVFYFQGLYQLRPGQSRVEEAASLIVAVVLATLILTGLLSFYREYSYSRVVLLFFLLTDALALTVCRFALRLYFERLSMQGHYRPEGPHRRLRRAGPERGGADLRPPHPGLELAGYVDDPSPSPQGPDAANAFRWLGRTADTPRLLVEQQIDEVYVALPLARHDDIFKVIREAGKEGVDIKVVPDLLEYIALRAGVEDLDGIPIVNLTNRPLQGWNSLVKRSFDIVLASSLLVALSPLLALIALAIWIEDRGPILFRQERMGLDGRPFDILKFRSMFVGAEARTGAIFARPDDSRRTRLGRILREWSLDELPQLLNVISGAMSLVGPRPERPEFVTQFKERVPQYMLRHKVKSGITGWAQVNGWRGNTSIEKRIEFDLYYIENWSLGFDVKILWMTLRTGFRHENAY